MSLYITKFGLLFSPAMILPWTDYFVQSYSIDVVSTLSFHMFNKNVVDSFTTYNQQGKFTLTWINRDKDMHK